jgi:hypothetical protein
MEDVLKVGNRRQCFHKHKIEFSCAVNVEFQCDEKNDLFELTIGLQ